MLERFKVPADIAVRVPVDGMRHSVEDMFMALGMPEADALQAADVLLYADIRGCESHGVSNMMRVYVRELQSGEINPTPEWRIIRDSRAAVSIDSDRGLGLVVGPPAMEVAIERAKAHGIGAVTVTNGRHYGAAAYHAHLAVPHDMIGLSMTAGGVQVTPTWGAEPIIGLNPIGVAVPAGEEAPFVFDASMSSVAGNKIRLAQRLGVPVLPGWIAESDGAPIMEESAVPPEFLMLPAGGTREIGSHKGYGLAVMVEALTSLLAGGHCGPFRRAGIAHYFQAIDIDAFTEVAGFKRDFDEYLRALMNCTPAPGHDRVVYAGLVAAEEEADRRANGIPYHPEVVEWFQSTCGELGVRDRL
ncbi:MAG: Ldh family oxidoreductase [Tepidiformaceae bacterium]